MEEIKQEKSIISQILEGTFGGIGKNDEFGEELIQKLKKIAENGDLKSQTKVTEVLEHEDIPK